METLKELKKEILKNKEVKAEYNALGPEFVLLQSIIKRRLEKGISQKELAKRIGTKQSAISRFESGGYNPTFSFLQKIANAMNLNLQILFSEK